MKAVLIAAILIASLVAAHALGVGREGLGLGRLGEGSKPAIVVIPGCASPTAPNGVVDLSQCSNAFYAAVIF